MEAENKDNNQEIDLIIEAILFSSERPLGIKDLANILTDFTYNEIKLALERLCNKYKELKRSFHLVEIGEGFQFRTRREYGTYIQRLYKASPYKLSGAALETLAVIAYRQPISRYQIEDIRGVDVTHTIKVLMEKGLIKVVGRKDIPGRPLLYGTTNRFLEVFGLKDIRLLPGLDEIGGAEMRIKRPLFYEDSREVKGTDKAE